MVCTYCGAETQVVNSRHQKRQNQVWRRRKCIGCTAIFTSLEAVDLSQAVRVVSNESYEPFSRDRLLLSVYDSLRHRKTAIEDATALVATIISQLLRLAESGAIQRDHIVAITSEILSRFDTLAATHYQAFHP